MPATMLGFGRRFAKSPRLGLAMVIGCLVFRFSSAEAGLFAIAGPQFSGFVDEATYAVFDAAVGGSISKKKLRDGTLYFSFRVIGGSKAIAHLKKFGSLEVRVILYAGWSKLGTYSIGIDQENWRKNGKALTEEYDQNGVFNWRTFMQTQQVDYPEITVKISDANSDYVGPVDVDGAYEERVMIVH